MSFTAITEAEIDVSEPVKNATLDKIRLNLDDHESRILVVEGASSIFIPIIMRVGGNYSSITTPLLGVLKTTLNFDINITGVRILIDEAGSAGSTEIDLKYSRAAAAYVSIFSTKPTISYTAGSDALSTSGTLDGTQGQLEAGDVLRLDITSKQTDGVGFLVRIDWNLTF